MPKVLYAHSGFKSDYKKVLDFIGLDYKVSGKGKWIEMKSGSGEMKLVSKTCLLYTSPSPRDATLSRMPSSA